MLLFRICLPALHSLTCCRLSVWAAVCHCRVLEHGPRPQPGRWEWTLSKPRVQAAGAAAPARPVWPGLSRRFGASFSLSGRLPAEQRPRRAELSLCRAAPSVPALLPLPSAFCCRDSPQRPAPAVRAALGAANPASSATTSTPSGGLGHRLFEKNGIGACLRDANCGTFPRGFHLAVGKSKHENIKEQSAEADVNQCLPNTIPGSLSISYKMNRNNRNNCWLFFLLM